MDTYELLKNLLEKLKDKKIRISLKTGFQYISTDFKLNENSLFFTDIMGHEIWMSLSEIGRVEEVL